MKKCEHVSIAFVVQVQQRQWTMTCCLWTVMMMMVRISHNQSGFCFQAQQWAHSLFLKINLFRTYLLQLIPGRSIHFPSGVVRFQGYGLVTHFTMFTREFRFLRGGCVNL